MSTATELFQRLDAAHEAHQATAHTRRPSAPRWPLSALVRLVGPMSQRDLARRAGIHERQIARWFAAGSVPDQSADRLAIALGWHPVLIWPEWAEEVAA